MVWTHIKYSPISYNTKGGRRGGNFTSLLSMEASLLSPWALVRPSLLLLLHTGPRLVQKVGSSVNRNTCLTSEAPVSY